MSRLFGMTFVLAVATIPFCCGVSPASAQATRTWVSGVGDDANPCSRTAPCQTFAGAIAKTTQDGEINCLDPGDFGAVTITKSITIDCHEITGPTSSQTTGITVAFDSFAGADTHKTVNLRNLMISDGGPVGIWLTGFSGAAGSIVNIEDCLINGVGGGGYGIIDARFRGAMTVTNTTIRNMEVAGIDIMGSSSGSLRSMITNTRVYNATNGVLLGTDTYMMLSRSVVSDNLENGVELTDPSAFIAIDSTEIAHNGTAFFVFGGATLRLSNSDVFLNTIGSEGAIQTFTNNRFTNNGSFQGIVPIGSTSNPTGEQ